MPSSPPFLEAIDRVDAIVDRCRQQTSTTSDFRREVVDIVLDYLSKEDPRDDINELVDYIVDWAGELGSLEMFGDRVLVSTVEEHLRWCLDRSEIDYHLEKLLIELEAGLTNGDPETIQRLVSLCRDGVDDHELLFSPVGAGAKIVELAHKYEVVEALSVSLRPNYSGRLAAPYRDNGRTFRFAFDALGHIAAQPDDGQAMFSSPSVAARDALIELAAFVEVGAWAALRLPVHMLDADQRADMLKAYDQRQELVKTRTLMPNDEATLRELEVIRTALWQAADADTLNANPPNC